MFGNQCPPLITPRPPTPRLIHTQKVPCNRDAGFLLSRPHHNTSGHLHPHHAHYIVTPPPCSMRVQCLNFHTLNKQQNVENLAKISNEIYLVLLDHLSTFHNQKEKFRYSFQKNLFFREKFPRRFCLKNATLEKIFWKHFKSAIAKQ